MPGKCSSKGDNALFQLALAVEGLFPRARRSGEECHFVNLPLAAFGRLGRNVKMIRKGAEIVPGKRGDEPGEF